MTGRPGDAPGDLLKLYLDGYLYRLRSSRRLAQEAQRHGEVLWRLKKLRPDHKTMANFRQNNLEPLRQVCRPFTLLGKKLDRFGAALVASAGRKCSAVNATERHFTTDKLTTLSRQIDEGIDAYLQERERSDAQNDRGTAGGAHAKALAAKIAALTQRPLREESFHAPRRSSDREQRALTDPESRARNRGKGRGTAVCSNVQTAVDAKPKLMVACEVTHDPGDRAWRRPLALPAHEVLGCRVDAVADVGDDHGHAVKACLEAGITPDGPRPLTSAHEHRGLCSKADFTDDSATDPSQCPAGQVLTFRVDTVELGRHLRHDATAAGKGCALTQQCTRRKDGRRITRWVDAHPLAEMAQRVRSRPAVMKRRTALVEHPFGTMKRWWEHGYVLRRGLEKVRTEFSLTVLAYKLRRVLNLVEMPRLIAALG